LGSLLKLSVSLLLVFSFHTASAGDPTVVAAGAAEAGMGYACIMKEGFWPAFHNQALLPYQNAFGAAVSYENRFGLRELGTEYAAIIIPAGKASLGGIVSHSGYADFSRSSAGLACGITTGEKLSAGIQIDYFRERYAGEYGSSQALTFEAGLAISASEKVTVGIHIFNPLPPSLRKKYMPSSIRAGAGIWLSGDLFTSAELRIASGHSLSLAAGFEFEAAGNVKIRGGYTSEDNRFSLGTGFLFRSMRADIAFITHQRLGISSNISLTFIMNNNAR
jgi:hypothetical protein